MQLKQIQAVKARISEKMTKGDYITVSRILSVSRDTAVQRFRRNNADAVDVMRVVVEEREKLIKKLQLKYEQKAA